MKNRMFKEPIFEKEQACSNQPLTDNKYYQIGYEAYQEQGSTITIPSFFEDRDSEDFRSFVYGVHTAQLDYIDTQI